MKKKTITNSILLLLIIVLSLSIIILSARIAVFDKSFYRDEFLKLNVYMNLKDYDADYINTAVLDYLEGYPILKHNGFFNQREVKHLQDVKMITQAILFIFYMSIILLVILLILLFILNDDIDDSIKKLGIALISSGLFNIILFSIIFLLVQSDFASLFDNMHLMLFEQGSYTFNPSFEKIVLLYPKELFFDITSKIVLTSLFFSFFIMLNGIFVFLYHKKNTKIFKH